jgi:hypothetical protein
MSSTELQYERNRYSKLRNDLRLINQKLSNSISDINAVIDGVDNYYKINDNSTNLKKLIETKNNILDIQNNINNIVLPSINEKISTLDGDIAVLNSIAN